MQSFNMFARRCAGSVRLLSHKHYIPTCESVRRIRTHAVSHSNTPNFAEIALHIKLGNTEKITTNLHKLSQNENNYTLMFDHYEKKHDSTGMKQFMHLMQKQFHISPEIEHLCTL